jgi:hypothetical protein
VVVAQALRHAPEGGVGVPGGPGAAPQLVGLHAHGGPIDAIPHRRRAQDDEEGGAEVHGRDEESPPGEQAAGDQRHEGDRDAAGPAAELQRAFAKR